MEADEDERMSVEAALRMPAALAEAEAGSALLPDEATITDTDGALQQRKRWRRVDCRLFQTFCHYFILSFIYFFVKRCEARLHRAKTNSKVKGLGSHPWRAVNSAH